MQSNPSNSDIERTQKSTSAAHGIATFLSAVVLVLAGFLAYGNAIAPRPVSGPRSKSTSKPAPAVRATQVAPTAVKSVEKTPATSEWTSLFDGKSLDGWKITDFGGQGEVKVDNGAITLPHGNGDLTGVSRESFPQKINYEVELEAMRVDGSDFFCGITFPVKDQACSLILGGWGGGLVGLSSLDGFDASENETSTYREFKNGQWYKVRLKVTEARIEAWIDDEQIVDADIENRKVSVRIEVELSRPFGLASWRTTGAIRNIRVRPLAS
jgi:hypothetical protein